MKHVQAVVMILALSFTWLVQGCDRSEPEIAKPQKKQQVTAPMPKAPPAPPAPVTEQSTPGSEVWPPVRENMEVEVADNLFTKNYYVVLDFSGSMSERDCSGQHVKQTAAKTALARFAQIVPADANLGFLVFSKNQIEELVPLGTNNRQRFDAGLQNLLPYGQTPLRDAIEQGYQKLEEQARKQLGYGGYTLVVITDGAASEGQDPTDVVQRILAETPVQIHTIGFCIGTNHSLNMPGRTVYKSADNLEQLSKGLEDVLAESEVFDVSGFDL